MKVIDLADQHREIYFQCLEDWSEEIKEASDHKEKWELDLGDTILNYTYRKFSKASPKFPQIP